MLWNKNFNLFILILIIIPILAMVWFALFSQLQAAINYITIFLVSVAIIFVITLFIDEEHRNEITSKIRLPFDIDLELAVFLYLFFLLIPIGIYMISGGSINASQIMPPLAVNSINSQIQTFAVAQATNSAFLQALITNHVASTVEELAFGVSAFVLAYIFMIILIQLISGIFGSKAKMQPIFYFIGAIIIASLIFAGIHKLNNSYTTFDQYRTSAIFRGAMNTILYTTDVSLAGTIGYHTGNNFLWFLTTYGYNTTASAYLNNFLGLGIVIFHIILLSYVIFNFPKIMQKFKNFEFFRLNG